MAIRTGGFLDGVDGFDAAFFGISPREAVSMDPQQRLLLEVAWEALEDAGIAPDALAGTPHRRLRRHLQRPTTPSCCSRGRDQAIDAYLASGNASQRAAGPDRLHARACKGPALSVDTACSSSLVAVHLAVQALRSGRVRPRARRRRQRDPVADRQHRLLAGRGCWRRTAGARRSTRPPTATSAARAAASSCSSG